VDEKTGEARPTGDCILLFGKNPRDKFPQASVKAKVDYGGGQEPDAESFDDPLVLIPDKVKEWVKKLFPKVWTGQAIQEKRYPIFHLM